MPQCFFHMHNGRTYFDEGRINLPDLDAVHMEAIRISTKFLTEGRNKIDKEKEFRLDVTDANGLVLLSLTFLVETKNIRTNPALLTGVLSPA